MPLPYQDKYRNTAQVPIELRTDEVQEIISYVPHWLVRWGITVFFFLLLLLVAASWIIHYPDLVKAPFRLTSSNAPKSINAKIDGKLVHLQVSDHEGVKAGQVLAFLESTADHREVLSLSAQLDSIQRRLSRNDLTCLVKPRLASFSHLGEIQAAYQVFDQAYTQLLAFQSQGFYPTQKKILEKELTDLVKLDHNLQEQQQIYQQDWEIADSEFNVQKGLAEQKVIAPSDLRRENSRLLAKQLPLKQAESALLQNQAAQSAKRKEILALDKLIGEQMSLFLQSLNTLRSALESWKSRYVLTAPITGKVFFSTILEEKQTLATNQEVFFIGPESDTYFGEVLVPQQNMGKVKIGQTVLIKFTSYPFQEFGIITGRIIFLSEIPSKEGAFVAKVSLPGGLRTNYNKQITYRTGMNATAEIITEDKRLIERVFYNFRKALAR